MTAMSPDEFYCGFVLEDYDDWKDTPESIRRGFHLAVSAFHLADHYFQYHARHNPAFAQKYNKLEKFQAALTQRSPAFKTIQDMAIAYKHLYPRATARSRLAGRSRASPTTGKKSSSTGKRAVAGSLPKLSFGIGTAQIPISPSPSTR